MGIVENLMDIRTKAAKATSHYYLCSPLTHYCQVRGRHGGVQRGVGGCCTVALTSPLTCTHTSLAYAASDGHPRPLVLRLQKRT